ncbi:MAG: magnesium chelatase subunit D family protein [Promethearchaeota archaeon]
MTHKVVYPFTAIIGQDLMKLALILNAVNPQIGGVLIRGMKGTAKSTAVRALADVLPEIQYIKSCTFNCNPSDPKEMCHSCQEKYQKNQIKDSEIDTKKMRVITLPINATEDRVVGTIDIKRALKEGLKFLEPGILAEAHRNILYIDEVNLLADNVADILLDSAAMGLNIIEREGLSFHHPSSFILVGTMNPEEGNLRPQLLDRFGLSIDVERIKDVDKRVQIVKYVEEFQNNPHSFINKFEKKQNTLRRKIIDAKDLLNQVTISDDFLKKIAKICIALQTDGHRADITITRTAKTLAAFEGRNEVIEQDIKTAAKLALNHRLKKLPFEDYSLNEEDIENIFNNENPPNDSENEKMIEKNLENSQIFNTKEEVFEIDGSVKTEDLIKKKKYRKALNVSGQRVAHPTKDSKGKYIGGIKPKNFNFSHGNSIAINETINEAALDSENQELIKNGKRLLIKEDHIHLKKRRGKSSYLVIFCVDASGSMGVNERMKIVKGIIFSLLQNNYIYRDKVSLVVFRKDKAEVILPPTRSTDLAYRLLKNIPTGGTTPLVQGLMKSVDIALEETRKKTGYIPLIVLLTDARGNVYFNDPVEDIIKTGKYIAKNEINMIIIDTENSEIKLEISKKLSEVSNAAYYHIDNLNENNLNRILSLEGIFGAKD